MVMLNAIELNRENKNDNKFNLLPPLYQQKNKNSGWKNSLFSDYDVNKNAC